MGSIINESIYRPQWQKESLHSQVFLERLSETCRLLWVFSAKWHNQAPCRHYASSREAFDDTVIPIDAAKLSIWSSSEEERVWQLHLCMYSHMAGTDSWLLLWLSAWGKNDATIKGCHLSHSWAGQDDCIPLRCFPHSKHNTLLPACQWTALASSC